MRTPFARNRLTPPARPVRQSSPPHSPVQQSSPQLPARPSPPRRALPVQQSSPARLRNRTRTPPARSPSPARFRSAARRPCGPSRCGGAFCAPSTPRDRRSPRPCAPLPPPYRPSPSSRAAFRGTDRCSDSSALSDADRSCASASRPLRASPARAPRPSSGAAASALAISARPPRRRGRACARRRSHIRARRTCPPPCECAPSRTP